MCVKKAETVGSEAVVDDDLVFILSQEGAELCLYIMELQLPPRPTHECHRIRRRGLELAAHASIHSAVFARTPTSRGGR